LARQQDLSDEQLFELAAEVERVDGRVTVSRLREAAGGGGRDRLRAIVAAYPDHKGRRVGAAEPQQRGGAEPSEPKPRRRRAAAAVEPGPAAAPPEAAIEMVEADPAAIDATLAAEQAEAAPPVEVAEAEPASAEPAPPRRRRSAAPAAAEPPADVPGPSAAAEAPPDIARLHSQLLELIGRERQGRDAEIAALSRLVERQTALAEHLARLVDFGWQQMREEASALRAELAALQARLGR